jgi:hypothetical protein
VPTANGRGAERVHRFAGRLVAVGFSPAERLVTIARHVAAAISDADTPPALG